jgi:predicted nucleotide-binding protein
MADPLRSALEKKYSRRHIDRLVSARASEQYLTRRLAMLSVARDLDIKNWPQYASEDDMATLRGTSRERPAEVASAEPARARPVTLATRTRKPPTTTARAPSKDRRDRVFVVHGRNEQIRKSMFTFLWAVGLDPLEFGEALIATGKPMPYINEALEAALTGIAAVVVLITPDDEVVLKERFWRDYDPEEEKKPMGQARPNVFYEAGMAVARYPRKVVFVFVGRTKDFSDIRGLHVARLSNNTKKRQQFLEKLRMTGADVRFDGRTEWHDVGDFEIKEEDDGNQ